ncbi:MAG: efflux transporter outer membrane subunit [Gammaproteobacteria bacterium]|nr:efflux transporter outer membrane subunit [Gammaproteobacteria bacterium]
MSTRRHLLVGSLALVLGGCLSTPQDGRREKELQPDALGLSGPAYVRPGEEWWRSLGDPQLDRLVAQSLAGNPTLAVSLARVRGAWEQARIVGAGDNLHVDFDLSAFRTKVSGNYIYPPPYAGATFWDGRVGFNFAWNLDFWGRQASLIEQASMAARASEFDAAAATLALSGTVAQTYVDLERITRLSQLADRAAGQRESLLSLTRQRVKAGLDSDVELRTAEANRAQADVEREQARVGREIAVHSLAALSGQGANAYPAITAPELDLEQALPVPDALPADLLAHRPDVAAARARVVAARAGREAAHAAFYPNVNLIGFLGLTAVGLEELPKGNSRTWNAGPAIHLPVLDAGRLKAEYGKSTADLDAAVSTYNETVIRAIRETADQAARVQALDRQLADQARALAAAEQAWQLAEQRYRAGLTNFLTVLNAETQVLAARRQRVNLLADRTLARVALLVALGGSFDATQPTPLAAATLPSGKENTK